MSVRSLTDKTRPQPTKWPPAAPLSARISGPRDTWDPKQGSLGPHSACKQISSARTAAKTGKIHLLVFLARFGPRTGPRKSTRPPITSKSRIAAAGGRIIGSRGRTTVAQRSSGSDEPKIPETPLVAPGYGQKTSSMGGWVVVGGGGVKHRTSPPAKI